MSSESEDTDATATDLDLKGHGLPFDWHARPRRTVGNAPGSSSHVYTDSEAAENTEDESGGGDFHDANGIDMDMTMDYEAGNADATHSAVNEELHVEDGAS